MRVDHTAARADTCHSSLKRSNNDGTAAQPTYRPALMSTGAPSDSSAPAPLASSRFFFSCRPYVVKRLEMEPSMLAQQDIVDGLPIVGHENAAAATLAAASNSRERILRPVCASESLETSTSSAK